MVDSLRKNITREYKAKLTKEPAKSLSVPKCGPSAAIAESLRAEEKQALEALFEDPGAEAAAQGSISRSEEIFEIPANYADHGLVR